MKRTIINPLLILFVSLLSGCLSGSKSTSNPIATGSNSDGNTNNQSGTVTPTPTSSATTSPTATATATATSTATAAPTDPTSVTSDCSNPGIGVFKTGFPYIRLAITKHGIATSTLPDPLDAPLGDRFISTLDLPQADQGAFNTDAMRFRVKAHPVPPGHSFVNPSPGCRFPYIYTKLRFTVGIRPSNTPVGTYSYSQSMTVNVNECSPIVQVPNLPIIHQGNNIAIDIFSAESDWRCVQDYANDPINCAQLHAVSSQSCWQVELHVETDSTNAIPGPQLGN